MDNQTAITRLEQADRLCYGDHIQRIIAGNLYESLRQWCRVNPETTEDIHRRLPRGYQLIPPH